MLWLFSPRLAYRKYKIKKQLMKCGGPDLIILGEGEDSLDKMALLLAIISQNKKRNLN